MQYSPWARNTYERPGQWCQRLRQEVLKGITQMDGYDGCWLHHGFYMPEWLQWISWLFSSLLQLTNVDSNHAASHGLAVYSWFILIRPR